MTDTTSVHLRETDVQALNDAAEAIFGTTEVPYRVVVQQLIDDHDEVDYSGGDDNGE